MSVDRSVPGRRSVRIETEVPGTPEQVWQAIATGPGISSWFMPCRVDGRVGGAITIEWAPGVETSAAIKAWEPPHRLAAQDSAGWAPNMPPVATEWIVEARGGGTCVVRVVHSMFTDSDDWNDQLEGTETGWPVFFAVLRIYLQHFRGQRGATMALMAQTSGSGERAYASMAKALGLGPAAPGQRVATSAPGAPSFAGVVESGSATELMLRADEPAPGVVVVAAHECNGAVQCSLYAYLYGDRAAAVVEREKPKWNEWLQQCFPAPAGAASG
jgi:uncharacterized protein YndB with AHSA1/START domain